MKRCLYKLEEPLRTLEVWECNHVRWLSFGNNNIQSRIDMHKPYRLLQSYFKPMMAARTFSLNAKNVLILGLGGGAMVHYLQYYHPELAITVIENDPEIVMIAERYFAIKPQDNHLEIKTIDALDFMKSCQRKYDLIFVDIFSPDKSPDIQYPDSFYELCSSCLSSKGAIAFNSVCSSQSNAAYVMSTIHHIFYSKTLVFPLGDTLNLVVLGTQTEVFEKKVKQLCKNNELLIMHNSPNYGLIARLNSSGEELENENG